MENRERNEDGEYADLIPPDRTLEAFAARDDQARPLTAGDVATHLDIARRTAHNKLNRLVERGDLATMKVGARGRVWWVPDTDRESDSDTHTGADSDSDSDSDTPPPSESDATEEVTAREIVLGEDT